MNKISLIEEKKEPSGVTTIDRPGHYYLPPVANDHVLAKLQTQYGEIVAWWIVQNLPQAGK